MKAKDLRNSILQLAVQGKLVPQDPADEPASALLERIRAERAKLVKDGKLKAPKGGESVIYRASDGSHYEKRGKGEPVCIDDEIPFEIPENWAWCRLESAYNFIDYRGKTPTKSDSGVRLMTASNIRQGYIDYAREEYISVAEYETRQSRGITHKGDILFTTEAPMGFCALNEMDICSCGQRVITFQNYYPNALHNALFCQFILSPAFQAQIAEQATGTTAKGIKAAKLKDLLLPVPPRKEQVRIEARITQTAPIVERYGALEDARERLDDELPDRLRKSVLQMAVQGKLVEQDPTDEPASVLLERIRAERAKFVKAGKLKAPKGGESIIYRASDGGYYEKRGKGEPQPVEVPFEIPDSWEWVRLKSLGEIVGGGTPKTHDSSLWSDAEDGIPWITPADMKNVGGKYVTHGERYLSVKGLNGSSAQLMPAGTVVMSSRAPIGYLAIAGCAIATNQGFKSVVPVAAATNEWILLALDALMNDIKRRASGTTFKEISGTEFGETLIPLPPFAEQAHIISCAEGAMQAIG